MHAPDALRLIPEATERERRLLGALTYLRNTAVLHTDASVLPPDPRHQASWNVSKTSCAESADPVRMHYDLNRLQRIDGPTKYVVSLNPAAAIAPDSVIDSMVYEHPLYTVESQAACAQLAGLSGRFDAAAMVGVLEHLTDHDAAVQKVRSLLAPAGVLYVSSSCYRDAADAADYEARPASMHAVGVFGFTAMPVLSGLLETVERQAMSILTVTDLTAHYWRTIDQWRRRIANGGRRRWNSRCRVSRMRSTGISIQPTPAAATPPSTMR